MSQAESTRTQVAELAENTALLEQQRLLNEMLARSATDKEFRQLLLSDARAAFARYGAQLPEGLDVRFVENHHDATIVLPNAIDDMLELSEDELAQMGGASIALTPTIVSSLACGGAGAIISASVVLTVYLTREQ